MNFSELSKWISKISFFSDDVFDRALGLPSKLLESKAVVVFGIIFLLKKIDLTSEDEFVEKFFILGLLEGKKTEAPFSVTKHEIQLSEIKSGWEITRPSIIGILNEGISTWSKISMSPFF